MLLSHDSAEFSVRAELMLAEFLERNKQNEG